MSFSLNFQHKQFYSSLNTGITIDAVLRYGNVEIVCPAKIDTGSEFCLFGRSYAEALDIEVESGYRERFSTLGGGIIAFAHEIELETVGLRFQSYIYFAESRAITRNLLGRQGWLQMIKLGLDDYNSELYIEANDELSAE